MWNLGKLLITQASEEEALEEDIITTDITITDITITEDLVLTDGDLTTPTTWTSEVSSQSTTQEDGIPTYTTKCSSTTSTKCSSGTISTDRDSCKEMSSTTPTAICAWWWEWLLLHPFKKCGKQQCSAIQTTTAGSAAARCSWCSKESRA